ncbi:glycosyltransferase family 4 protein [Amorphoplanes nipponensis]|uniref:Glycosyl transferase n=1 Tax=Actinoplanes nipponensis TaxID=135950 RepID=A0A919JGK7_9ACTN|nr:glycosyltransferase family 4 protein [Actinoplanes nipponensis]GIE50624.1 glycosyl transferase [Actinoplanes nipponensis]
MTAALHVVLPGGIDDPAAPSGGNTYDRRVLTGLAGTREVHEIAVGAAWPYPAEADRAVLARALDELPAGATVLLDGLVGCAVPELLEPLAGRLRLVVLVHLPLGDETGLPPAAAAELTARERRTVRAAAAVVATSDAAARRLETLHDLNAGSVHVAAPGVDPAPLATPGPAGDRLLCVAALTPRKAQDVLVRALHAVAELPWTCTLVGALDRDPAFVDRVRDLAAPLSGRVVFAGTRTGEALAETYRQADLLVLPSLAETYGMVVTEALARGVPVLGTLVAGVPEALGAAPDGARPGTLVPPGDVPALAAALRRWLTDPAVRRDQRAAAAARRPGLPGWDLTTRRMSEVLHP